MALDISRVSAVCFDVDGTLRDTDDSLVRQITAGLRRVKFLFNDNDITIISRQLVMSIESPGNYLHNLSDRLHMDGILDSLENQLYRRGLFSNIDSYQMIPGVYQMLNQLRSRYPLAVVTARGEWKTLAFLDKFELTHFFSAIATSQTCRYTKPFPDPIIWAADQMGVEPGSCLMVGDTTVDMRAGKAATAQTVGVLCGFGERDELLQAGADLILTQTGELTNILLANPLID
jgi:HAD superfamily hydrolase (TIGR01509 family)